MLCDNPIHAMYIKWLSEGTSGKMRECQIAATLDITSSRCRLINFRVKVHQQLKSFSAGASGTDAQTLTGRRQRRRFVWSRLGGLLKKGDMPCIRIDLSDVSNTIPDAVPALARIWLPHHILLQCKKGLGLRTLKLNCMTLAEDATFRMSDVHFRLWWCLYDHRIKKRKKGTMGPV